MDSRPVRVGVVGLGAVAQAVHLPLLAKRRDLFQVTGVCDLSPALVAHVVARFGLAAAAPYQSPAELLDSDRLDAVLVLTSGSHAPLALAALRRGLPVLCEKPLAYTLAEADELLAAVGDHPRLLLGYMKLYDPAVVRARELAGSRFHPRAMEVSAIRNAEEIQLAHARAEPAGDMPPAQLDRMRAEEVELTRRALGPVEPWLARFYVGVLLGSLVHELSLVRALAGKIGRVEYADAWPSGDAGGPSSLAFGATLTSGARLTVTSHHLDGYPGYHEEIRVHHDGGSVLLSFPSPYLLHAPTTLGVREAVGAAVATSYFQWPGVEAFEEELVAFHRLVVDGTPPAAGVAEGRADVQTCQQVARRLAERCGVAVGGEAVASSIPSEDA